MSARARLAKCALLWQDALGELASYLEIPCLSPAFDAAWEENGHIRRAAEAFAGWAQAQLPGAKVWISAPEGATPAVVVEVAPTAAAAGQPFVLFYGHLDKQPPLGQWADGLGPFQPVGRGDRLFGRGSADDGYALFAAVGAIRAAAEAGGHGRCIVLIEASEESGSPDLGLHLDALGEAVGRADLVVCLDSGCATYDRLWVTTSLRGLVAGTLAVEVLSSGVHSGSAGGVVPSSFRIARALLDRIEDSASGEILPAPLRAEIPPRAEAAARALADAAPVFSDLAVLPGLRLEGEDDAARLARRNWGAALEVVGADGLPPTANAGNVLRPYSRLKLAIRLPPSVDAKRAGAEVERLLCEDPPQGARVTWEAEAAASGWVAKPLPAWLSSALEEASLSCFGQPHGEMGEGGSIPFLHMLSERAPEAAFLVTGVLGPGSNAHGIDESLHVPTAQRLTAALSLILEQRLPPQEDGAEAV